MMLPPASFTWPLQGTEQYFIFDYGYDPRAYVSADQGNGTELSVYLDCPGHTRQCLFQRLLDPAHVVSDRGNLTAMVSLPSFPNGSSIVVETKPGQFNDTAWDWAYIAKLRFIRRPEYHYPSLNP